MKTKVFEKICDVFGGYYEQITDNDYTQVTLFRCKIVLFPDELNIIKRKAAKEGFKLQYITIRHNGIGLQFIKKNKSNQQLLKVED